MITIHITTTTITTNNMITMIEFRQAPILEMALEKFTANYQGQAWAAAGFKSYMTNIYHAHHA